MRRGRSFEFPVAILFFLAATVVFTWPLAPRAARALPDLWDAKLNAWILHWDFHQIFRDPVHLYDANIFYPSRYALAFSENLIGAALFAFPLYAAGVSTLLAYNVIFLLGMFLSALAAWALAREETGDSTASLLAGLVFAFCPWRLAQLPHVQFQWGAFLALLLLFLLRYLRDGRRRDAVFFGICFGWNALCNIHYAIFSGFLVGVVLLVEGLQTGWVPFRPRLAGAVWSMVIAGLVVLPLFVPYALASRMYGMHRWYGEIDHFSGRWSDFLSAGFQNKLYGAVTLKFSKPEGDFFPGLVPLALAIVALSMRRRAERRPSLRQASPRRRRVARFFDVPLLIAVAVYVASRLGRSSLGPLRLGDPGRILFVVAVLALLRLAAAFPRWSRFSDLSDLLSRARPGRRASLYAAICLTGILVALGTHTPFYRFLVQSFGPLFHMLRSPARGVALFDLGLSVLASFGLAGVIRNRSMTVRMAVTAAVILLVGFEYRAFPIRVSAVEPVAPRAERFLAGLNFRGGVVEWPLSLEYDFEHEFRSTAHWKPILNGFSGFWPRSYDELRQATAENPIPDRIWSMLSERRAALMVFHPDEAEGADQGRYARAILRGVALGRLAPLRSFEHEGSRDLLFRLTSAAAPALPPDPDPAATREALGMLVPYSHPPFGVIAHPQNEASADSWGFGWALDDSGVSRILVSLDDRPPFEAIYGGPFPGVASAYPAYPDAAGAGFGFPIPRLDRGSHRLKVTIVARDGGRADLIETVRAP